MAEKLSDQSQRMGKIMQNTIKNRTISHIANIKGDIKNQFISHIYKILQEQMDNNLHIKTKWELEMDPIISHEYWTKTCSNGHRITDSPT